MNTAQFVFVEGLLLLIALFSFFAIRGASIGKLPGYEARSGVYLIVVGLSLLAAITLWVYRYIG
jgi:hypothetical protein